MNLSSKSLCLALLGLTAFFAGCNHTPSRTPDETISTITPPSGSKSGQGGSIITPPPYLGGEVTPRPQEGVDSNGDHITLQDKTVYFGYDSSGISKAEATKIQAIAKYLTENPAARLLLEGHCDWRGTAEYNLGLGDRRATAVKQYLEKLKVPTTRLDTLSKGSIGATEKATEEQMAKDRRVEFVIQKAGAPVGPL
jgi:peptidoglycan-associated lipoprotein